MKLKPEVNAIFKQQVKQYFDFLIEDYGFSRLSEPTGYLKGPLEIEFYNGKGETDILMFVRSDDEIFRPFISRSFDLYEVFAAEKGGRPESLKSLEDLFSANEENEYLAYYSIMMKRYCKDILKGDLSTLGIIHLERRDKAK